MRFGADRWALYAGLAGSWVALAGVIWVLGSPSRTGVAGFGQGMGVWPYARTQFGAILMYLKLSVWPDPLIVDYGVRLADGFWQIWPAAAGVAVLLAATAWALIRRPMAGFVGAWVFGILAPTSTVIPLVMQTVAEKRMYLPLAGLVALAVVGVFQFGRWVAGRLAVAPWISGAAGLTAAAVIVAVLGWRTIVRNGDYDSPLRLWQDTVNKNPGNYRARGELGHYLTEAGRIDEAFGQLDEAIRLNPAYPQAYNHRGSAYAQRGDTETARSGADLARARADYRQAVADYTRAIDLNLKPTIAAKVYNNRGNAYASLDEFSRAIADYGSAIRLVGGYVKAYYNRGCTRLAKGDTRDAIADFTKAIELAPGQPRAETFNNRANAYRRNGDYKRAIADYTRAIELNPELAGAYINRAIAYDAREEFGKALADVARAIELNPNLAGAYSNRAVVFFHQKDYAKAWADVKKCQALGGEVPPDFLADLRAATGGYR